MSQRGRGSGPGRGRGRGWGQPSPASSSSQPPPPPPPPPPPQQQPELMMGVQQAAQRPAGGDYMDCLFVRRPGTGTLGRPIRVVANHYAVHFARGSLPVYHFDVTVEFDVTQQVPATPPSGSRQITPAMIKRAWNAWEDTGSAAINWIAAFDGRKNAYATSPIPQGDEDGTRSFRVTVGPQEGRAQPDHFMITFVCVNTIDLQSLARHVSGQPTSNEVVTAIQALDIVFRQMPAKEHVLAGRSMFSRTAREARGRISGGLEIWSGLFQSVRPGAGTITLNLDAAYKAFLRPMNMIKFVEEVLGHALAPPGQEMDPRDRKKLQRALMQTAVVATHRRGLRPRYRIAGISERSARDTRFRYSPDGTEVNARNVSVAQYFQEHYGMRLSYPNLPCFIVGNIQRQTFLPMEVTEIEAGQVYRGRIDERQTAEMIRYTATAPAVRRANVEQLARDMLHIDRPGQNPYLQAFGVRVDPNMMQIDARVLDAPRLVLADGVPRAVQPGAWRMQGRMLLRGARLAAVGVLNMDTRANARQYMRALLGKATKMGLHVAPDILNDMPVETARFPREVSEKLSELADRTAEAFANRRPDLLVVILPRQDTDLYALIKHVGDTQLGIPTQCMQSSKLSRQTQSRDGGEQYYENVVLKINSKVCGRSANFQLDSAEHFAQSTMLVGLDVTHPAPRSGQPSIAAMVGSITPRSGDRFAAKVQVVQPGQEELQVDVMKNMFAALLRRHYEENGQRFPDRLIFFRDGVSEGQFATIKHTELQAIYTVLQKAKATNTRVTFIVVQKRHHTRLFAASPRDTDRSGNLPPGVVVDRGGVVHPTDFDFYLQAQAGLQGTARPTRYFVLDDQLAWPADQLERFCYHLCYTYARCTRSVSIVPPAYYAHLACFRARHHLAAYMATAAGASLASSESAGRAARFTDRQIKEMNEAVQPKDLVWKSSMFYM